MNHHLVLQTNNPRCKALEHVLCQKNYRSVLAKQLQIKAGKGWWGSKTKDEQTHWYKVRFEAVEADSMACRRREVPVLTATINQKQTVSTGDERRSRTWWMPMSDWCDRQMLRKRAETYEIAEKKFWQEITR